VAVDVERALVGIEADIEQGLAVTRPDHAAAGVEDGIGKIDPRCSSRGS
jgi:hypothetical protein